MPLTEQERTRLRHLWAGLARAALGAYSEEFRRQAFDAPNWKSPLDHDADAYVLFGFARLAKAQARSRVSDLTRREPMLNLVALEVLHMLDVAAPHNPSPTQLPFRADLDG